jgi:peptidoglycan/xylan/chitin deacetylase (PgdA/CDA1 family)
MIPARVQGPKPHSLNGTGQNQASTARFYFTVDCDWVPGSQAGLERLLDLCDRYRIKGTIFFAGRFAESYPELVRECHRRGHQLGTHGWAHGGLEQDEDFRLAGYAQQREWISRATDAVEQASGIRPVIFRAPNLRIGEATLRALEDEGYRYDSSVPARRFDMGFGRVHYTEYFWAPLEPYNPSWQGLHRPGKSSILEIPPSACLFPINLATLRVLGLPALQRMIDWIGRRSQHLVFYCHPSEFILAKDQTFPRTMSRWNRWGMSPANLPLMESLIDYVLGNGYALAQMMNVTARQLDLTHPLGISADGFLTTSAYKEE